MTNYDRRIETLENFMKRLTLSSYIAKAAEAGDRVLGEALTDGDEELAGAVTGDVRVNQCVNRLDRLEKRFNALYDEIIGKKPVQDDDRAALGALAKAQSASLRRNSAEGLLDRAQRVLTDPTAVGMVETFVQGGQLVKAAELLERHEARADQGDEDEALHKMESQLQNHEQLVAVSELAEKMGSFEGSLNSILNRLSRLERPASAPLQEQTVAKGYGGKKRQRQQEPDYRDSTAGLAERCQGVIDNASLVGQLNSMLQSGEPTQIKQARETIEAAELRHESRMKARDRRIL